MHDHRDYYWAIDWYTALMIDENSHQSPLVIKKSSLMIWSILQFLLGKALQWTAATVQLQVPPGVVGHVGLYQNARASIVTGGQQGCGRNPLKVPLNMKHSPRIPHIRKSPTRLVNPGFGGVFNIKRKGLVCDVIEYIECYRPFLVGNVTGSRAIPQDRPITVAFRSGMPCRSPLMVDSLQK